MIVVPITFTVHGSIYIRERDALTLGLEEVTLVHITLVHKLFSNCLALDLLLLVYILNVMPIYRKGFDVMYGEYTTLYI